jgi:cell division protein ZapA
MAEVTLTINGRAFQLACDDGQEDHVRRLGEAVDSKVRQMAEQVGAVGEPRLLLMASLLLADELNDARQGQPAAQAGAQALSGGAEAEAAEALERAAARVEDIAARLEES